MKRQRILDYESYVCDSCRDYVYSEDLGDAAQQIQPHTLVEDLPPTWHCPKCGANKDRLLPILALGSTAW